MKKASVFFLAATALIVASCSSDEASEENGTDEAKEVTYVLDAENSQLKWHGEENEQHYHDGVISITEGSMVIAGENAVAGEFIIDPSSIKGQTQGYPAEKMDYLSSHLMDTAFLFTAEYPTVTVKTGTYEDGQLNAVINVRGVDLNTKIPVSMSKKEGQVTFAGKFAVDFSPVGMPYLESINEETGEPSAKSDIQFDMNLVLSEKK